MKSLYKFFKYPKQIFAIISFEKREIYLDELDKQDKIGESKWDKLSEKIIEGSKIYMNFSSAPNICSL